jgi:hypothetical protein
MSVFNINDNLNDIKKEDIMDTLIMSNDFCEFRGKLRVMKRKAPLESNHTIGPKTEPVMYGSWTIDDDEYKEADQTQMDQVK